MKTPKILVIPSESFPTRHAFLEEVYTRNNELFTSVFLMKSGAVTNITTTLWNNAKVYLLPKTTRHRLFDSFVCYFIDLRYLLTIPRIVFRENITIIQVRDMTFPLFVSLLLKCFLKMKVVYQKSFPLEIRFDDRSHLDEFKLPWLMLITKKLENVTLHKLLLRQCDAVLPISESMKQELHRRYNIPCSRMFPFGLGINVDNLKNIGSRVVLHKSLDHVRLVYVGTLSVARNCEEMIKAVQLASSTSGIPRISLAIIGGTRRDASRLKRFVHRRGMEGIVEFHGHIDRLQVYKEIGSSDIAISYIPAKRMFIHASPTKLFEYLALGVPVVATDCVLLQKRIIEETQSGVLAKADPKDFSEKLVYLIHHLGHYKELAERSRSYIHENFSYNGMRYELSRIYRKIQRIGDDTL